ncbi:MAG: DUF4388 domain-containing protein [Myxococcaceae bacterium]
MFPNPSQVLKAREGSLDSTPLPLLIRSIWAEERDCALELKMRQLEKKITFEDGHPVSCGSNLLHETLGKYLVEKGKVPEAEYQKLLAESAAQGIQMGNLLVGKGILTPFDLYKQLQANLAIKILDAFRWTGAHYRIVSDPQQVQTSVRMNPAQLIWTGVGQMPFETVMAQMDFDGSKQFAVTNEGHKELPGLKASSKDQRLLQVLKSRPTFPEICEQTGLDTDVVYRRLYSLCVMGYVDFAENVTDAPAPAPVAAPAPVVPTGMRYADDDEALKNELMTTFLAHRSQDPFTLLAVDEHPQPQALRKSFLQLAEKFSPLRFQSNELKEKAEAILAAAARAYGSLSEPETQELWRKRRAASREKAKGTGRPTAAEQFRIRTDLLDASSQFSDGKQRLHDGSFRAAFELFEYTCDIDPRPLHRAYRAWARHLMDNPRNAKLALTELHDAVKQDPSCEEAYFFAGEVQRHTSQWEGAEECYRRAFKLNPNNRKYVELIQECIKMKGRK